MNPYFLVGVLLAIGGAYTTGHWQGDTAGQAKVQQLWDKEKADQLVAYVKAQDEARAREQQLQAGADKLRQEKDREIREINARSAGLLASVQQRPDRTDKTSGVSTGAGACVGASGAELAKGDAIFLVGYSSDVAKLQASLDQCVAQYEAVRGK